MRDDAGGEGTGRDDLPVTEPVLRPGGPAIPSGESVQSGASPETLERGSSLGRYLILDRLGQGGMGVVYAAYDRELDRKVAVKLLRGERARDGGARLLREAQAMARLQHPNVIAVHDVGTFGGRVFVAMEFVDGETLAAMRERSLGWRETLALFIQAGRGLAAAHAAGLVHRDFKPENALVGRDGRVRVLDFGLARAILDAAEFESTSAEVTVGAHSPGLLATPLTRVGAVVGTPAFIAPEQFEGEAADARSDQYSFAVALYGALYGKLPFRGDRLDDLIAAVRAGNVEEPPDDSRVPRWLRAVLLRAMARDPAARYPSMDALLAALADDPLARRRKLALWAAGLAAVALVVAGLSWQVVRSSRVCSGAAARLTGVWDGPRRQTIEGAFTASALPFAPAAWSSVAHALDAYAADWVAARTDACQATRHGEQSVELMDRRMSCLDGRLEDLGALTDLLAKADAKLVEKSVAAVFALPPLSACSDRAALLARVPPPADVAARHRVEETRKKLAHVRALRLAGRYAEGRQAATELAPVVESEAYAPLRAEYLLERGDLEQRMGEFPLAESTLYEARWAAEEGRDSGLAAEVAGLAVTLVGIREARHDEGVRWAREGLALVDGLGGDERLEGLVRSNLGTLYNEMGDAAAAERELLRALELRERTLGPNSPDVGRTLNNLGTVYYGRGDLQKGLESYNRALAVKEATLGAEHPDLTSTLNNIALVLSDLERYDEALADLNRSLAIKERALGPKHPLIALDLGNLGAVYEEMGRSEEALAAGRRALAIYEEALGPDHPDLAYALTNIGNALVRLGRPGEARPSYERAVDLRRRHLGADHPQLAFSLTGLGRAFLALHQPAAALVPLRRAVEIRAAGEVDKPQLAESRYHLARAVWASGGSRKEARALAEQARSLVAEAGGRPTRLRREIDAWLAKPGSTPP
jgi:tetratricopeptide (TPR) repeat protein/predicted Ser/Thr protein kinase